ncbi:MAG: hypothetical protein NT128_00165, partial [Proteobacteria bacterium]|nr:hypothetical protein [Pseudomonadota bacterium]
MLCVFKLLIGAMVVCYSGFLMSCYKEMRPETEQARRGIAIKVAPAPVSSDEVTVESNDDIARMPFGDLTTLNVA